ncbi:E3 ubiquitin-protein ligase ZNRF2-like [Pollicipes pollicipes]|uniref:E3 ubiquitin-protein ligase ZNRF2-like n=2 Tax=Pollicipes pollicipes TaxID=41117 RepID=UPI0018851A22|nr:E3 ubiquitin-protein ligase ZNRF2-like [Pollicipes pollicipes]
MGVAVSRCVAPELPFKGRSLIDWLNGAGRRAVAPDPVEGAAGGASPPDPAAIEATGGALPRIELGGGWSRVYDLANVRYVTDVDSGRMQVLVPEVLLGPGRGRRVRHVVCGIKCPVCNKFVLPDDVECHIVMCLTKPRISYNEDVLTEDKGECVICLEELEQGQTIARLPCLCIYHKRCIDDWFKVNRTCPEHPGD